VDHMIHIEMLFYRTATKASLLYEQWAQLVSWLFAIISVTCVCVCVSLDWCWRRQREEDKEEDEEDEDSKNNNNYNDSCCNDDDTERVQWWRRQRCSEGTTNRL